MAQSANVFGLSNLETGLNETKQIFDTLFGQSNIFRYKQYKSTYVLVIMCTNIP